MEPNKSSASKAEKPHLRELKIPSIYAPPQLRSESGRMPDKPLEKKTPEVDFCSFPSLNNDEDAEIEEMVQDSRTSGLFVPARKSFAAPTLSSTKKSRQYSGKGRTTQSEIINLISPSSKSTMNKEDRLRMDSEQKRKRNDTVSFENDVSGLSPSQQKKKKTPRDLMFRELIYLNDKKLWGDCRGIIVAFMEIYDRNH